MSYVVDMNNRTVYCSLDKSECERKAEILNMQSDNNSYRVITD